MPEDAPSSADSNPRRPGASLKVVITGPWGVGKTTMIRGLSEITVVTTERRVLAAQEQQGETVPLDFGRMSVEEDLTLYLFGTPGEQRLESMWEVFNKGLVGFILLVDETRPDSIPEAREVLNSFTAHSSAPYVVGVNKVARAHAARAVQTVRHQMRLPAHVRVVAVDVRQRDSAKDLLLELLLAAHDAAAPADSGSGAPGASTPAAV